MRKNIVRIYKPRDRNGNRQFLWLELFNGGVVNITDESPEERHALDVQVSSAAFNEYKGIAKRAGFLK